MTWPAGCTESGRPARGASRLVWATALGRRAGPFFGYPRGIWLARPGSPAWRNVRPVGHTGAARRESLVEVVGSPRPMSVLIVEDQPDVAESLKLFLDLCGYDVAVAPDGEAGVEAAITRRPAAVVCDIGLPKKDGFQVAEEISTTLPRTPLLIAVTGYGTRDVEDRARRAGFQHFIVKPADPFELERLLREHQGGACPTG